MKVRLPKLLAATKSRVIAGVAILLLVMAGIGWFWLTRDPAQSAEPEVITHSTNRPSEEKPGDDYNWQGGPEDPKKIIIPSVGINGFIQNVGVDQNQEIAVPNNVHVAGWFVDSVLPGQKGLSIIDGHVDGLTQQEAIFRTLPNVQKGAEVTVEFGNGSVKKFSVFDITEVDAKKAPNVLFSQDPGLSNQLNLITCIGNFNQTTLRYDKRVIVSTKLLAV